MAQDGQERRADTPNEVSSADRAAKANADQQTGEHTGDLSELETKKIGPVDNRPAAPAPEKEKKRDAWDVAGLIAGWFAALIIPVVLGVTGYYLNLILKNRESQTKMVELAIDLLKIDPKGTDEDKGLRNWAMDVIDKYSEVKLPEEVRKHLQSRALQVSPESRVGSARSARVKELNLLKSRYQVPTKRDIDPAVTFGRFLLPGNDRDRFDQNKAATITAFVVGVSPGGVSTANLGSKDPAEQDTRIELAKEKYAPVHQYLHACVTPRFRQAMKEQGVDWTTEALGQFVGKRVEITGWLLFDSLHANEAENTNPGNPDNVRATCWEIHPVTDIKVAE